MANRATRFSYLMGGAAFLALTVPAAPVLAADGDDVPPVATDSKPSEKPSAADDNDRAADDEDKPGDRVRFRGGFDIGGGFATIGGINGGVVSPVYFRLGVQFNHYFGLVYQNTPLITLLVSTRDSSVVAGVMDENSALAILTLAHFFDLGAGPSLDLYAIGSVGLNDAGDIDAGAASGIAPGIATRVAFNIGGGPKGKSGRRSAFTIGVDPHFTFFSGAVFITLPVGLGAEFF